MGEGFYFGTRTDSERSVKKERKKEGRRVGGVSGVRVAWERGFRFSQRDDIVGMTVQSLDRIEMGQGQGLRKPEKKMRMMMKKKKMRRRRMKRGLVSKVRIWIWIYPSD